MVNVSAISNVVRQCNYRKMPQGQTAKTVMKWLDNGATWTPQQNLKHCTVSYKKIGTSQNGEPLYQKIVTRDNGTTVIGHFDGNGCYGTTEKNVRGVIDTSFGAQNYDKVVSVQTSAGDMITRLGHTDRSGFVDTYKGKLDRMYKQGNFQKEFDKLIATVRDPNSLPAKIADIVAKVSAEWKR